MLARLMFRYPLPMMLALLAVLAGGAWSARAGLTALAYASGDVQTQAPLRAGFEADDHFPGAAELYLAAHEATPAAEDRAPGSTGFTAIPDELAATAPVNAALIHDASIVPAPATPFRGRTTIDTARAVQCLATAIYYEAASESDDGQRAVAQVVLNRVRHPAFPNSVCGVVYQGFERTTGCQFSFTCDGALARLPSRPGYARAVRIASEAMAGRVYGPVGHATFYHTFRVWPRWGASLVMTDAVGAHFFHRYKGYWGTPAAFTARYSGVEPAPPVWRPRDPAPAPLPPVTLVSTPLVPVEPLRPAVAVAPVTEAVQIQPAWRDSGTVLAAATPAVDSQVLDRWKDSGKPLR